MKKVKSKFGPWALVTGASSGIGEEFARQLARTGLNLVLVARRGDVLQETADYLSKTHGIKTRVISADLSDPQIVDALPEKIADIDIGLVISNAGADSMGALI
ncbi:MAG: SDR family NAD(P)-dependent oxidoreductase, partial [Rhodobiaceae bacterium]|nr:SDR family NAD(P)-dependent oxidoreductase [Rhodobiaceae bacterium]